jgi:hypothetical protein
MGRRHKQMNGADYGTSEMSRQFTIVPKLSDPTTLTGKVMDGDEVDRMLLRDEINPMQYATLCTLAERLHGYGFIGIKSPDYSSPVFSDATEVSARKADTIRGAVSLIAKMDRHASIGRHNRKRVINLVCVRAPWVGSGLDAVIMALDDIFINRR